MSRNRFVLAGLGFALQAGALAVMFVRYGIAWSAAPSAIVVPILVFGFVVIMGHQYDLRTNSVVYLIGTFLAVLMVCMVAPLATASLWFVILYGLCSGFTVMAAFYHMNRLAHRGSVEAGFSFAVEMEMTMFGAFSYAILVTADTSLLRTILLVTAALVLSVLLGQLLGAQHRQTTAFLTDICRRGAKSAEFPEAKLPMFNELYDEMRKLFAHYRGSFDEISRIGDKVRGSSEDLSAASEQMNASLEEVSSTIQHIAKGAQEQSESITKIAHSIEELNNLTTSISSQVKMASVSSKRTNDSAKQGLEFSTRVARVLKDVFEQTGIVEEKMGQLREQSIEIKKVLEIINNIAEQTDLLALNAAIEAARVGEQGRGFAVVADEIRNLANETQRSAATVESLIQEISRATQELKTLLDREQESITEGNALASQTEEQFTGITKAIDLVADMISRINSAATNQSTNTKELVKQVEQVAQVAADTAASTEEVSAAVEEQTASMEEFTSTAQVLSNITGTLETLLKKIG